MANFIVGNMPHAIGADALSRIPETLRECGDLLAARTRQTGRSMGVYRTGQTLAALTVKQFPRSNSVIVTYNGTNRRGERNGAVAFHQEYGARGRPARPFNRVSIGKTEPEIEKKISQALIWE